MIRRLLPIAERREFGPDASDQTQYGAKYPGSESERSVLWLDPLGPAKLGSRRVQDRVRWLPGVLLPTSDGEHTSAVVVL